MHEFGPASHIIIATPTAPPTTSTISLHHPLVMGASAVCKRGLPEDDPEAASPAVLVGEATATPPPAATTVTAVTTEWLPLGSVLVCTTVLVVEDCALLLDVVELPDEGEMVCTPPPTVETMMRPTALVLVMTSPCVRGPDEVAVVEGDSPAEVEVDVVALEPGLEPGPEPKAEPEAEAEAEAEPEAEPEAATIAPLDEVLVEVVVEGKMEPAPVEVALGPPLGLVVVLEVSPPPP